MRNILRMPGNHSTALNRTLPCNVFYGSYIVFNGIEFTPSTVPNLVTYLVSLSLKLLQWRRDKFRDSVRGRNTLKGCTGEI